MSENLDRGNLDHTRFDTMKTEELEELLRLDCDASSENLDTEDLLYVMEVLAERSKHENITGKTAQESWESFNRNYRFEESRSTAGHKPWLRRFVAATAVIALLVCVPIAAHAFGWEDIWNAVAKWAKETFSFVSNEDAQINEPDKKLDVGLESLMDVLSTASNADTLIPTYIPEGYTFKEIITDENPIQRVYIAIYSNGDRALTITVRSYLDSDAEKVEIDDAPLETFEVDGTKYYIFENDQQLRAVWGRDSYECYISGELSLEEIKAMIESIGKG